MAVISTKKSKSLVLKEPFRQILEHQPEIKNVRLSDTEGERNYSLEKVCLIFWFSSLCSLHQRTFEVSLQSSLLCTHHRSLWRSLQIALSLFCNQLLINSRNGIWHTNSLRLHLLYKQIAHLNRHFNPGFQWASDGRHVLVNGFAANLFVPEI